MKRFRMPDTDEFDPLRTARGIANGIVVSLVLWAVIAIVLVRFLH